MAYSPAYYLIILYISFGTNTLMNISFFSRIFLIFAVNISQLSLLILIKFTIDSKQYG